MWRGSVEVLACDPATADADLMALAARCCAQAEGVWPPDREALARMRSAQQTEPEALTLALAAGEPAGMCAVGPPDQEGTAPLWILAVLPEQRRRGIGRALEARAVSVAQRHQARMLRTHAHLNLRNQAGVAFLERLGWEPEPVAGLRMWRDLENLPPVELPEGYAIRSYQDGDAEAFVRIKNAAFAGEIGGGGWWTLEDFRKEYLDSPLFRPERVFFAICGEELVGTTTAWTGTHEEREVGVVHWVAVVPEHRGRGLGEALNLRALHHLREMGYREAILNTNSSLQAAVRLYHRLGFREYWRWVVYGKKLGMRE